jgi:hypothetical protein
MTCTGMMRNAYIISDTKWKENDSLEDINADGTMLIKWIWKK